MHRFECSVWEIEEKIGDHIADAYVVFEDPHEEYGKGLALEYQHMNEGKDIREVELDYARNGFTTVWAWEDQFDYSTNIPDIDLFAGRVCTPWPECVPASDEWADGPGMYREIRSRIEEAPKSRPTTVKLPKEWADETAQALWAERPWEELFSDMESAEYNDETEYFGVRYDATNFILEVRDSSPYHSKVPVTLPPEITDDVAQEIWQDQDWDQLFWTSDPGLGGVNQHLYRSELYLMEAREMCSEPKLDINWFDIFPRSYFRKWVQNAHKELDNWRFELPSPDEWSGTATIDTEQQSPTLRVPLPAELSDETRSTVKLSWSVGAGCADLDLVKKLRRKNAPRQCAVCGERSQFYLLEKDVISEYRCEKHTREIVNL